MGKTRYIYICLLAALAGTASGSYTFTGAQNNQLLTATNWVENVSPVNQHLVFADNGWTSRNMVTTGGAGYLYALSMTVNSNVNSVTTDEFQINGWTATSRVFCYNGVSVDADVSKNVRLSGYWGFNAGVNANPVFQHYGSGILQMQVSQYGLVGTINSVRFKGNNLNKVSVTTFSQNWIGTTILDNVDMAIARPTAGATTNAIGSGLLDLTAGSKLSLTGYAVLGNSEIQIENGTVFDVSGIAGGVFTNATLLQGKGTVVGDIYQTGALRAGPGIGTFTFQGGLAVAETSSVGFELGTGSYDVLANDGGDTLVVAEGSEWKFNGMGAELLNGIPMTVLAGWGSISGSSTNIVLTNFAEGYSLDTSELFTSGVVTVRYSGPPPASQISVADSNSVVICWDGGTNKAYAVQRKTDLLFGTWSNVVEGVISGNGGMVCVTNDTSASQAFYQVVFE
ncbi:MAG: hypothetical protein K9M54_02685 [Kiritimatiellales bacterium]|nr:hypothetical protein [Kiritimatiellales bacterium]